VPRVPLPDVGIYLHQGDVNRLLRGHYSPVIALTDSCVDPTRSPLLRPKASFEESLQVATSPCCWRDLPDVISANPSRSAWAPVTAVRGVHLPVSSPTSSAFPRTLSRSASRVSPSKRFHDGSLFRDCSHFVMFRPSGLLASQIVPTAATYRRRAAEAFTSEQNMRRCLRMHRIC
jgi:hypothetical protein